MQFYVYVLANPFNAIYVGQTEDLIRRVQQHNDPANSLSKHTKRHSGPWRVIHSESFNTREEALRRERQLKTSRGRAWIRSSLLAMPEPGRDGTSGC